jgi:hypothetical protein
MNLYPSHFWKRLHWATRIAMLAVFFAILWWQARYIWTINNPMYGWPMPFNNVWYRNVQGDWRPSILLVDAPIWLMLTGSVGYTLERWRRRPKRFQTTLGGLFVLQGVVAALCALGCMEGYLRAHPNNGSMWPLYARWDICNVSLWFDLGLFTDPPLYRFPSRLAIIFAIGCFVYTVIRLLSSTVRRVCGGRVLSTQPIPNESAQRDPILARIVLVVLAVSIFLFSWGTLLPSTVR